MVFQGEKRVSQMRTGLLLSRIFLEI